MIDDIITTEELEKFLVKEISKSKYKKILIKNLKEIYVFTNDLTIAKRRFGPFTIIFSDSEGYHKVSVGDRGEIKVDNENYKKIEICYTIVSGLAFTLALDVEKKPNRDWRRELFNRKLEILLSIDKTYYQIGQKEIEEILSRNPYDDTL